MGTLADLLIPLAGSISNERAIKMREACDALEAKIDIAQRGMNHAHDLISLLTDRVKDLESDNLDSRLTKLERAVDVLDLARLDLIIVENVGNLVCPVEFDCGEDAKVAVRNERRDANDELKKQEKAGELTEDDLKKALEDVARDTPLVEAREAELTSALEQLGGHLADLSAAGITIGTDLTVEQWAETSAQLSKLIGKIGEARAAETRVAGAEQRQQAIRDEITAHEAQLESVVARLGELPAIIESLRSESDATAALARLDVIKSEIDKLAEQKAALAAVSAAKKAAITKAM
mgnify:CR=1 FL=1